MIWDNNQSFYERMVQTMNRLFNSITLTETQKNALFAFGKKDKIGTGVNLSSPPACVRVN